FHGATLFSVNDAHFRFRNGGRIPATELSFIKKDIASADILFPWLIGDEPAFRFLRRFDGDPDALSQMVSFHPVLAEASINIPILFLLRKTLPCLGGQAVGIIN